MSVYLDGVPVQHTAREATLNFGYDVAKGNLPEVGYINKFGENNSVGATLEEVWDYSGPYQYLADDTFATMYVSSDNAGDTGLVINVQGVDDEYNMFSANVTTDGANGRVFVALDTGSAGGKAWRVFRVRNTSATAALGNIYISKDNTDVGGNGIPDTVADIQAEILIGQGQTLMALWTSPKNKTTYLTNFYCSTVSAKVTKVRLYYRPFGGSFNVKHTTALNASANEHEWHFPSAYAGKGDFAMKASAVGAGGIVSAGFSGWYE